VSTPQDPSAASAVPAPPTRSAVPVSPGPSALPDPPGRPAPPGRLAGEVALVTGGWRGIGAAVVRAYAAAGARVAINYPPGLPAAEHGAHQMAAELAGTGAIACCADVSDQAAVQRMVAETEAALGPVSILVANAATSERLDWTDITEEAWNHVMAVNVTGTLFCAQAVYPAMRRAGRGKIITLSSVMVELGGVRALHYVTSKAALIGFTRSLAREVGHDGICVNSVMPGAIKTESEEELYPGTSDAIAERQAEVQSIPRRGVADDLAGTFLFLGSRDSDFVTGQVIAVEGGWIHY
jgi:3-oxoacyl-[acyl-carrier protein] reductase